MKHIMVFEDFNDGVTLYHGTSSNNLDSIKSDNVELYLTTDIDAAKYYAAMGGEAYFLDKESEFEDEKGITPQEYYDVDENGELGMFKALYPVDAYPIIIKFKIPSNLIDKISDFFGYKGHPLLVKPEYIDSVIKVDWDELDY